MSCIQSSLLPSGFPALAGKTKHRNEAECLAACKEGACCEGTTCSITPQCQCQGTGKTFKGVGTTCTPNPCLACGGCTATHPTYLTVAFTQTAHITAGYHESLIDLSGSYSIPSLATGQSSCAFSGHFTKTYAGAMPSGGSLFVNFNVDAWFYGFFDSPAIALQLYGVMYNSLDPRDRGPGLYQFTVTTGTPSGAIPNYLGGNLTQIGYGSGELQRFSSCVGNTHTAARLGYTLVQPQYKYVTNDSIVECGAFSWSPQ